MLAMNIPVPPQDSLQSQGGKARAAKLSKEKLSEIAKKGGQAKAAKLAGIPRATHEGDLVIGDRILSCAVIPGEVRLISERALTKALGAKRGGSHWKRMKEGGANLPVYLSANNLRPFISNELMVALTPVTYQPKKGSLAHGQRADALPKICNVFLRARDAGALLPSQENIAVQADMLMRGLAEVGIIALVDEATGYQRDRAKDALAHILESFISKELRSWTSTFPIQFYEQIFRLHGWPFDPANLKRPGVIGHWTNDFIYARLAPGVLEELKAKNPVADGRRKHKHFQWLTGDIGEPRLKSHIDGIVKMLKGSATWDEFKTYANKFYPRMTKTELGFDVEDYSKEEAEAMAHPPTLKDS